MYTMSVFVALVFEGSCMLHKKCCLVLLKNLWMRPWLPLLSMCATQCPRTCSWRGASAAP